MTGALHEYPLHHEWEPEPLHLPIDDRPPDRGYHQDHNSPRNQRDEDLPGSHVIVIDFG